MNKICLWVLLPVFLTGTMFAQLNKVIENDNKLYLSNTIVIKLKSSQPGKVVNLNSLLTAALKPYGTYSVQNFLKVATKRTSSLNSIVVIQYQNNADPLIVASKLKNLPDVEWAEPKYVYKLDYTPNDPLINNQYNLTKINAYQAWDISKGDSAIIIAIVDTGTDWDHPDLAANIWMNKDEIPGNSVDDDGNGYVDDIRGWDFGGLNGTPDNDPVEDAAYHGTFVAGVAGAVSDNNDGIASIGYNSTIMPIKAVRNDNREPGGGPPYIVYGFEGIIYAVDNGARIINCSWGGYSYSILGQETVNYALENGSLVVAAAGNENTADPHYPSAYKGVLSVGSTDANDKRSSFTDFGITVDVSAPGSNVYSTWYNNTYTPGSGTSFSSPLAAGLAALVAQRFPLYSPLQIAEQIRINCDDINSINPSYTKMLGRGRINAFNALNNNNSISVRATDIQISDDAPGGNGNGILQGGETISIGIKFVNYLTATSNLSISLQSGDSKAVVQNGIYNAGAVATLDSFDNYAARFSVALSNTIPQNVKLIFTLNYSDGTYSDYQLFEVYVNRSFATQSGNNVSLTITSKGALGFNDYPNNTEGAGFTYLDGDNMLFEGALIYGVSSSKMVNSARNAANGSAQDNDFSIVEPISLEIPGSVANQEANTVFNDDPASSAKLGITINLHSYSYEDSANANYILLKYSLTNTSGAFISNFYTGLFFDWDLLNGSGLDDVTAFDDQGKLGYVYHTGGSPDTYVGSALVSSTKYGFWAIFNDNDPKGFGIYDGFDDSEKWQSISSGVGKVSAGPGDISHVISGGPFEIPVGESIDIAFVITAGANLDEVRTSVANARLKYQSIPTGVEDINIKTPLTYSLLQNYPNPFNPTTVISYNLPENNFVSLKIYDVIGNEIVTLVNEVRPAGKYEVSFDASKLSSGIYFYELNAGSFKQAKKMLLIK